jgi:hypothetical protein
MRYEPDLRVLTVVYRGRRGTYQYFEVPRVEWEAFRASRSKGTYLNGVFKAKQFAYAKLSRSEYFRWSAAQNEKRDRGEDHHAEEKAGLFEWGEERESKAGEQEQIRKP